MDDQDEDQTDCPEPEVTFNTLIIVFAQLALYGAYGAYLVVLFPIWGPAAIHQWVYHKLYPPPPMPPSPKPRGTVRPLSPIHETGRFTDMNAGKGTRDHYVV